MLVCEEKSRTSHLPAGASHAAEAKSTQKGVNRIMPEVKLKKGEPIERALRHLRKKMDKENTLDELRAREHYIPPCEARRRAAHLIR